MLSSCDVAAGRAGRFGAGFPLSSLARRRRAQCRVAWLWSSVLHAACRGFAKVGALDRGRRRRVVRLLRPSNSRFQQPSPYHGRHSHEFELSHSPFFWGDVHACGYDTSRPSSRHGTGSEFSPTRPAQTRFGFGFGYWISPTGLGLGLGVKPKPDSENPCKPG
jgi:hypothetical protein